MAVRFTFLVLLVFISALPLKSEGADVDDRVQIARIDREEFIPGMKKPDISRGLKVKEHFNYYDIGGSSPAELRLQMRQNGTKWKDGRIYAALTTWDIRYKYDVVSENGRYVMKAVTTDISIEYIFPRKLRSTSTASDALTVLWEKYMDCLIEHEIGHKDLAVKTAGEINETLESLGSFPSRSELDSEVGRQVQAKLKKLKEMQVEYDDHTRHGEKQGAVLM